VFSKHTEMSSAVANKNAAARRVSIVAGQKPQLLKAQSATSAALVKKAVAPSHEKPVVTKSEAPIVVPSLSEAELVRREKEALERELLLLKTKAVESEERAGQLASHVLVLEDLLEQKKGQLDFIEGRLESLGMDPVAVKPFEADSTGDRERELRRAAEEFEERLLFLRQGVERRNELLADSLRTLQHISEALEVLETQ